MDTDQPEWMWAADNCSVIRLLVSVPLIPEPCALPIPQLTLGTSFPARGHICRTLVLFMWHLQCLV